MLAREIPASAVFVLGQRMSSGNVAAQSQAPPTTIQTSNVPWAGGLADRYGWSSARFHSITFRQVQQLQVYDRSQSRQIIGEKMIRFQVPANDRRHMSMESG
jgi:hypothetical protein